MSEDWDEGIDVPKWAILYNTNENDGMPKCIAMFDEAIDAHKWGSQFRALKPNEFLMVGGRCECDDPDCRAGVIVQAWTANGFRLVHTDNGPKSVPEELAPIYEQGDCEEDDR